MQKNERHKRVSPVLGLSLFLSGREMRESMKIIKELKKCIREYKKPSLITPIAVSLEVVMECIIPFIVAQLGQSDQRELPVWRDRRLRRGAGGDGGAFLNVRRLGRLNVRNGLLRVCPQFAQGYVL